MLSFHKDHDFYIKHVPGKSTVPLLFSMSLPSPVRVPGCKLLCFATLLPSPLSACKWIGFCSGITVQAFHLGSLAGSKGKLTQVDHLLSSIRWIHRLWKTNKDVRNERNVMDLMKWLFNESQMRKIKLFNLFQTRNQEFNTNQKRRRNLGLS